MATGISPQVEINELDLSIIAQESFGHPYLILGEATRGRDDKPILVTNKANYVNLFGALDANMPSTYAAMEYLAWGNQLWYKRVTSTKMVKVMSSATVVFSNKTISTMTLPAASSPYLLGTAAQDPITLFFIDPNGTITPFKVYITGCLGSHVYTVIWDSYGVDWSDPLSPIVADTGASLTLDVYVSHAEPAFNSNVFFFKGDATTAPSYGTASLLFNNELNRQNANAETNLNNTDYYVSSYANTTDYGPTALPTLTIGGAGNVANGMYAYRYSYVNGTSESAVSLPAYITMAGGPLSVDVAFPALPTGWTGYNLYRSFLGATFGATVQTSFLKVNTAVITSSTYNDAIVVGASGAIPTCPVSVSLNGTAIIPTAKNNDLTSRFIKLDSDGKTVLGDYIHETFLKTSPVTGAVGIASIAPSTATADAVVTAAGPHGLTDGDLVYIYGATDAVNNGIYQITWPGGAGLTYSLNGTKGYYHPEQLGAAGDGRAVLVGELAQTWVIGTSPELAVGDTLKMVTTVNHNAMLDSGAYTVDTTDFSKTGQYLLSNFIEIAKATTTTVAISIWDAPTVSAAGKITSAAHGLHTGDIVYIENAIHSSTSATPGVDIKISNQFWRVTVSSATEFFLTGTQGMAALFGASTGVGGTASGTVRKSASASTSLYRYTGTGSYTLPSYSTVNAYQSTLQNNYYYYPQTAFYRYSTTSKGRGTWANGMKVYAAYNSTTEEFECLIYDINNVLQERWSKPELATLISNINEYSNYINLIELDDSTETSIVPFYTGISGTTSFAQYTQAQLTGGTDGYFDVDEADFIANIDTGVAGSKYSLDADYSDLLASSQMIEEFDGTIDYEMLFAPGWSSNPTLAAKMSEVCASRKFSACAVDLPSGLNPNAAVQFRNTSFSSVNSSYAAMYWNYVKVYDAANDVFVWLPPTVFAIRALAYTDSVAQPWYAAAGLRRGLVPEALELEFYPTLGDRDAMYAVQINPIARIGTTIAIWGNRTSQKIRSMLSNFNVRRMLVSAEKAVYLTSQAYLFEPNDKIERQRLLLTLAPIFDLIRQQRGLDEFGLFDATTDLDAANNTATFRIEVKPTPTTERITHTFVVKSPLQTIGS